MRDQVLLENAAKAIGLDGDYSARADAIVHPHGYWMPHNDDGDAIRLAVKLGMDIEITDSNVYAGCRGSFSQPAKPDPCAALRRAIVMAAAEIGEAMP